MTTILSNITLSLGPAARQRLAAIPSGRIQVLDAHKGDWDLPAELLHGPIALLCKQPPRNIHDMPDFRLLQLGTVGYEHLRDRKLAGKRFTVCNARGIFDTAIGEWNLAMMVDLTRDVRGMIRNQDQARWDRDERFSQEIRGRVVGLWGYGGIGRETARLAKAFGMTVHVLTRTGVKPRKDTYVLAGTGDPDGKLPDRVFTAGQEQEFLSGLDFLIVALPHTKQSDGMIGERELRVLPKTAYVLNPARGPIIQEKALLTALGESWIAGAAIDTHYAYPLPSEHALWRFPNVILTPHVSGADKSRLFPGRISDLLVQNVERLLNGQPLLNVVTDAEWREA